MEKKSSAPFVISILVIIAVLLALVLCHKKESNYRVYFGNLTDGVTLESPFKVEMKAENLVVEPASNGIVEGHGHFHIIIDTALSPAGEPVPMNPSHLHFGQGQVETTLDLPEGGHTLTLQFAMGNHVPYNPQVVQTVHIRINKRNTSATPPEQKKGMENPGTSPSHEDSMLKTAPPINPGMGGPGMGGPGTNPGVGSGMGH